MDCMCLENLSGTRYEIRYRIIVGILSKTWRFTFFKRYANNTTKCILIYSLYRTILPYKVKMQYVQISSKSDTSIKHPISGQSTPIVKEEEKDHGHSTNQVEQFYVLSALGSREVKNLSNLNCAVTHLCLYCVQYVGWSAGTWIAF